MRKVTKEAINAFLNSKNYKKSNTEIVVTGNYVKMYLFNNLIAQKDKQTNKIYISNCGWFTNTTKERLNGLPNVHIKQKSLSWLLNGKIWDGKLIEI